MSADMVALARRLAGDAVEELDGMESRPALMVKARLDTLDTVLGHLQERAEKAEAMSRPGHGVPAATGKIGAARGVPAGYDSERAGVVRDPSSEYAGRRKRRRVLSTADRNSVRTRLSLGSPVVAVAREFDVSVSTVRRIGKEGGLL